MSKEKGSAVKGNAVKGGRKSAGTATAAVATAPHQQTARIAFEKAANKTQRAFGSGGRAFWYLERTEDLEVVTSEASNEALGLTKIEVFEPTPNQEAGGIMCKIRLNTILGTIDNISIHESKHTAGDIYMNMGGRKYQDKDGKDQWQRDVKLTNPVRAQILSYVHSLVVPAEAEQKPAAPAKEEK